MVGALNRSVLTSHSIAYPAILEHRAVLGASSISWTFLLEEMAPAKLDTFCTSGTQIVGALLTQGRANHLAMKMSQCATIAGHRGHQQDSWPLRGPHLCPWAQWRSLAILQTWTTVVQLAHPEGEDAKLVTVENPKGQWGEGRARTPNGHQTGPRYPRRPGHVGHHPNISGRWWEQCFPALNQKGSGPLLKGQSEHLILKGGERGLFAR